MKLKHSILHGIVAVALCASALAGNMIRPDARAEGDGGVDAARRLGCRSGDHEGGRQCGGCRGRGRVCAGGDASGGGQPRRRRVHAVSAARRRGALPRLSREGSVEGDGGHVPRQERQRDRGHEPRRLQGDCGAGVGGRTGVRAAALGQADAGAGDGAGDQAGAGRLRAGLRHGDGPARERTGAVSGDEAHLSARWQVLRAGRCVPAAGVGEDAGADCEESRTTFITAIWRANWRQPCRRAAGWLRRKTSRRTK